ncbi:MAG: hypothetical protein AABZ74_09125 [Cyanobacteriota bacterium]
MKKIIITFIVSSISLFSCDNFILSSNKEKLNFSGKDCKAYNLGFPPVERFNDGGGGHGIKHLYVEKSPMIKFSPYLGKIKMSINQELLPFLKPYKLELKPENKIEIDNLEKNDITGYCAIKINNEDPFYFSDGDFKVIFNNSCEYDYFKSKVTFIKDTKISIDSSLGADTFEDKINIKNEKIEIEKIEIEKIEYLLHEYNRYYIKDIKEIEFSSINALKTFLLFIKLTTQEPIFYKDLEITIDYYWISRPFGDNPNAF